MPNSPHQHEQLYQAQRAVLREEGVARAREIQGDQRDEKRRWVRRQRSARQDAWIVEGHQERALVTQHGLMMRSAASAPSVATRASSRRRTGAARCSDPSAWARSAAARRPFRSSRRTPSRSSSPRARRDVQHEAGALRNGSSSSRPTPPRTPPVARTPSAEFCPRSAMRALEASAAAMETDDYPHTRVSKESGGRFSTPPNPRRSGRVVTRRDGRGRRVQTH